MRAKGIVIGRLAVMLAAFAITLATAIACSPKETYEDPGADPASTPTAIPTPPGPAPLEFVLRLTEVRHAPPLPTTVTIVAGEAVSESLVAATTEAMAASVDFFGAEYGFDISTTTIVIHNDLESFIDALAAGYEANGRTPNRDQLRAYWSNWGGTAFNNTIYLYPRADRPDAVNIRWIWTAVPHEATHLLQEHFVSRTLGRTGWGRLVRGTLPAWFVEGHAEWVGVTVSAAYAPASWVAASHEFARILGQLSGPRTRTLLEVADDDLSREGLNHDEYALGYLAVDLLAGEDDLGLNLLAFWDELGYDQVYWTEIFEAHFGMSVEEFYGRFEATRTTWK